MKESWRKSTAGILILMVATYAIVGGIMGYVVTLIFGGDGWLYGAIAFLTISLIIAIYCVAAPVDAVMKGMNSSVASDYNNPRLFNIVSRLSSKAGIPMPTVYVLDVPFPNAFALGKGPDSACVAATRPIMDMLTDDELEAVMAHELSHIMHRDTIVNGIARTSSKFLSASAVIMGGIAALGMALIGGGGNGKSSGGGGGLFFFILLIILIPIVLACLVFCLALPSAGAVMRYGVSRSREYGADESGARLCGKPMALASALMKLEAGCSSEANTYRDYSSANLWTVCPFGKYKGRLMSGLMDTHPSTKDRIERLKRIQEELDQNRESDEGSFTSEVVSKGVDLEIREEDGFRKIEL